MVVQLAAVEPSNGGRGVVLIHGLGGRGLCGWWDHAAYLSGRVSRAAVNHRCTGESRCPVAGAGGNGLMSDIEAAVGQSRGRCRKITLLGGSQRASEAVLAASAAPPAVVGVVALSADELTKPLADSPFPPTASAAAPKLRLPAPSRSPRSIGTVADTRNLVASVGTSNRRLVELDAGAGHGWDLVAPDQSGPRPAFSDTVVSYLTEVTS